MIGTVLVNPQHRSFGDLRHWEGMALRAVMTPESVVKFNAREAELVAQGGVRAVELNHVDDHVAEFPVRYALHRIDEDGSILMLGRDLRPVAEMQQQLVKAQLALERDYEAQREIDARYRVLMETTRDAILVTSMTTGRIVDLNVAAAVLLGGPGRSWSGRAARRSSRGGGGVSSWKAWPRSRGPKARRRWVAGAAVAQEALVVPTVFRAAGERLLMCRLELSEAGDAQRDELTENLFGLYHEGADGVVFTDADGLIRNANEAFLNLSDAASLAAVKGRAFSEFLARGGGGSAGAGRQCQAAGPDADVCPPRSTPRMRVRFRPRFRRLTSMTGRSPSSFS